MTQALGHPFLVPYLDVKDCYVAVVSNPIGELWDKISKKREYMDAVKDRQNEDDLCGCPDWPGYFMDHGC